MTWINFNGSAWHAAKHAAAMLSLGHIPVEVRSDDPYDVELDGKARRCHGYARADSDKANEPDYLRMLAISILCGMPDLPCVPPERNGWMDDPDMLALLIQGRWDSTEEFLKLRFEAIDLMKTRRFRRLAVAVYERLVEVEFLNQDDLRKIYEQEHENHAAQAA
jgi:hypothetical protein